MIHITQTELPNGTYEIRIEIEDDDDIIAKRVQVEMFFNLEQLDSDYQYLKNCSIINIDKHYQPTKTIYIITSTKPITKDRSESNKQIPLNFFKLL